MTDYKLVPVEPTAEMIEAAEEAHMPFGDMELALRMAILAAPAVQGEPVDQQPDVTQLVEALGCILSMDDEIQIVDVMDSKAREMVEIARDALAAYRKEGEVLNDEDERQMEITKLRARCEELTDMLEDFVEDHGYTSFLSVEEKEATLEVQEARRLIATTREAKP